MILRSGTQGLALMIGLGFPGGSPGLHSGTYHFARYDAKGFFLASKLVFG